MEDFEIVDLYIKRDEKAIYETQVKYGNYCYSISNNILNNNEDVLECLNDTYLNTWNSIPPNRPQILSSYVGKIIRRLSIDKYRKNNAKKRKANEYTLSLDEIGECVSYNIDSKKIVDEKLLEDTINDFLKSIPKRERNIFVSRYFYFESIKEIAESYGYNLSRVKMILKRTRDKLKQHLIREGYSL